MDSIRTIISFPDENICRVRITGAEEHPSVMVKEGYVRELITGSSPGFNAEDKPDKAIVSLRYRDILLDCNYIETNPASSSRIYFNMAEDEHFYGFGFQRKTLDARGHILTFTKEYRWDEATVPYFLSSAGYGFFSANTYDHRFDFTGEGSFSVDISGGDVDFFIIGGPEYKKIINSYTALTGRPHMVPAYALGLCYVGRLFETQDGILEIAHRFRKEGIPCDMIGLEPGWEKYYYQMKWVWNNDMFPDPEAMINELHDMHYAFELWESGDAPTTGYMDPENRMKWFSERVESSLDIGVDFYKQDDPYPRCITSEEMVTDPSVDILIKDDETRNIANTLYSTTVFDEIRRLTGKRAFIIFHAYCSTISSQMYPCVWAGDFGLGNGALNASLSGHSMVTQDMRSEVPSGIHFGFLLPFAFMDSWAYYLEPWLFSDHITEMIKFYSRFRVSLFPYLYSSLWQSHTTGLPMLRPMLLEFQNDANAVECENQYMLGDYLLVGLNEKRDTDIYLPKGNWIDYWSRNLFRSKGETHKCTWPSYAGGPLFVKTGAIIPMMAATDSITLNKKDFILLDIYPDGECRVEIYEDDGITYGYEDSEYELSTITCHADDESIKINNNITGKKAVLFKVFMKEPPGEVSEYTESDSFEDLLTSLGGGWYFDGIHHSLYIKGHGWNLGKMPDDIVSFYGSDASFSLDFEPVTELRIKKPIILSEKTGRTYILKGNPDLNGCRFNAVVNPPERVRLNHGDDWLPYYVYVGYEIVDSKGIVVPADVDVTMEISCSDDRDIEKSHKSLSYSGVGHFDKIIAGSPTEPPDIELTLSAPGLPSKTIRYKA